MTLSPMTRRNRDVETILLTKFESSESRNRADDHRWVELKLPGVPTIRTFFSHARQDIGDELWKTIASQLKVRAQYLDGMIDCTNSRDDYYEKVRDEPFPPWPDYVLRRLRR